MNNAYKEFLMFKNGNKVLMQMLRVFCGTLDLKFPDFICLNANFDYSISNFRISDMLQRFSLNILFPTKKINFNDEIF